MSLNQSEKMEVIQLVENSPIGVKRTLQELGISRSTFYNWYERYEKEGYDGLRNQRRVPKRIWNKIPKEEREKVVKAALAYPEKSCREIACLVTDREKYYVSESSVYRILRAAEVILAPVYTAISAKDKFEEPTVRSDQLWQMDFTYLKIIFWGWYYLLTVLDDFSRYIIAWKLCTGMDSEEVKDVLDNAMAATGMKNVPVIFRPGLLTDNGSAFIAKSLKEYVIENDLWHVRGRPFHPQTQGKIERYHRSMKNILLLDNYYQPGELENRIAEWVNYYNNQRYHEGINNVTPADMYFGRAEEVIRERARIKKETIRRRLLEYRRIATPENCLTCA